MAGPSIRKTVVDDVEVPSGARIDVTPEAERLISVTLPGGKPLPAGVRAVRVDDRLVLRYPDGTEVSIALD